jgi:hypothetical protein
VSSLRGREESNAAILVKSRVGTRRSGARWNSTIVGDRRVLFVPRMKSALVELGRRIESAPVHVGFSETEDIELVLEDERAHEIVLRMHRGSGKATDILETQSERMVHLDARV